MYIHIYGFCLTSNYVLQSGRTPLHVAMMELSTKSKEVVEILIKAGADVTIVSYYLLLECRCIKHCNLYSYIVLK